MFWKNLSVRNKLLFLTCSILLACVVGLSYLIMSFNQLRDDAEYLSKPQVQTILISAALAHTRWASELQEHLLLKKKGKLTVSTNGHKCDFGKWFYSDAKVQEETDYPALKPIFDQLDELHINVHATALDIQKKLDADDLDGAVKIFTESTYPDVLKVEKLLFEAKAVADKHSKDYLQGILEYISGRNATLLGMSCLFFVFFPIFSYLLIRSFTNPINKLMNGAKRIAGGEFVPVDLVQKDELGQLADSFNIMVKDLKKNLGLAQALMNGITMPCIICDTEGKVIFVNTMCLETWHEPRTPEECLGDTTGSVLYGKKDRQTRLDRLIASGEIEKDVQSHVVLRDGSEKFFNINAAPLKDMDGVLIGAVVLYSDLTAIYEQQLEIEKLNDSIYLSANDANKISNQQTSELDKLVEQLNSTAHMAAQQAESSQLSTNSLEQMAESMRQMASEASATQEAASAVSNEADAGMEVLTQTIDCIEQVAKHTAIVSEDMKALDVSAENIGRILNLIKDIADQTNLLALNAAIEAARAGDAGRGFAVVADEVRKLAEKTMEATNEVASAVNSIQEGVKNSVKSTNTTVELTEKSTDFAKKSGESLQRIREVTHNSVESARSISEATMSQSRESEAALQMIMEINEQAGQTQHNMSISSEYAATLSELSTELRTIINKMCDERRSCARYEFKEATSLRWDSEGAGNGMTSIVNISTSGICINSESFPENLTVGTTITLHTVGGPLSTVFTALSATIRWIGGGSAGLEFEQLQALDGKTVQDVLRRLPSSTIRSLTKK